MPRLPQIISDVNLQNPKLPARSTAAAAQPGLAVAGVANKVADIGQEMAQKQIHLQQVQEAMDKTSAAAQDAEAFYQKQVEDPQYETLTSRVQKGFQAMQSEYLKSIRDPEVQQVFKQHFESLTTQRIVDATVLQRKKQIDDGKASLDNSLATLNGLAVDASGQRLDAIMAIGQGNIAGAAASGLLSQVEAGDMLRKFKSGVSYAKAIGDIRDNPKQAATDLLAGKYPALTDTQQEELATRAQNRADTLDKAAEAEKRKADELALKKATAETEALEASDTALASQGKLSLQTLLDHQQARADSLAPYKAFERNYDLIYKPQKDLPSDKTLHDYFFAAANNATTTESELLKSYHDFLAGKPGLNVTDYVADLNDLQKALKTTEEGKGFKAQAMRIIDIGLGADPDTHRIGITQLTQNADYLAGTQKAIDAANAIVKNNYAPIAQLEGTGTKAAAIGRVKAAQRAYDAAVKEYGAGILATGKSLIGISDPYNLKAKTDELLNAARIAGMDYGDAPADKHVGDIVKDESGRVGKVINANGKLRIIGQ